MFETMSNLYENIRSVCNAKGISDGRLCNEIGVSRSFICDLKHNRRKSISTDNAQKIAQYLGVSVDYLLTGQMPSRRGRSIVKVRRKTALTGRGADGQGSLENGEPSLSKSIADNATIINRIEMRLIEIGMSKADFYTQSGISSATFSQWRAGTYKPSKKKLESAARVLGIEMDQCG